MARSCLHLYYAVICAQLATIGPPVREGCIIDRLEANLAPFVRAITELQSLARVAFNGLSLFIAIIINPTTSQLEW